VRPARTAIPSDVDEAGGKAGQPEQVFHPALTMPSAVADEKAGQPERALRPAMTAIPSNVGKVQEKAGQPHRAFRPAMTAIPSDVKVDAKEARALSDEVKVGVPQDLACVSEAR
jgi:hypothetical protein